MLLAFGRQSTQPIIPSLLSQPLAFMVIPHSLLSLRKRRVCQLVERKEEEEARTPPFKGTSHKQHGTLLCKHGRHSCTRGLELNYSTTQTHTCAYIYMQIHFMYAHAPEKHLRTEDSVVMEKPERERILVHIRDISSCNSSYLLLHKGA